MTRQRPLSRAPVREALLDFQIGPLPVKELGAVEEIARFFESITERTAEMYE